MQYFEETIPFDVGFGRLKGQKLTSVNFIHDYVQFGFESAGMSAQAKPILLVEGARLDWHSPRLRHELCALIETVVVGAEVDDSQILMRFEGGAELIVPFYDPEKVVAEALEFHIRGVDTIWVI